MVSSRAYRVAILIYLLLASHLAFGLGQENRIELAGTIINSNGLDAPLLVTARNLSKGITWTFLSDASGTFRLQNVPSGDYQVWIRSPNQQLVSLSLPALRTDHHLEVKLGDKNLLISPPSNAEMLAYLPEEGRAKQLLRFHCIQCHGLETIVNSHKNPEDWKLTVQRMANRVPPAPAGEFAEITRYLSRYFGQQHRIDIPATGSGRYAFQSGAIMVEFDLPGVGAHPHDMVLGPDNKMWVSDFDVKPNTPHNNVFRIDPDTFEMTTFKLPVAANGVRSIAFDKSGTPWMTVLLGDILARLNPETASVDAIQLPQNNTWPHTVVIDDQNLIWYTGMRSNTLGKYDPNTGKFAAYKVPTEHSMLYSLEIDAKGKLWYTGLFAHKLGKFDPDTELFEEYPTPTPLSSTRYLTTGPKGKLWLSLFAAGKIARFDPISKSFDEFPLPDPNSSPYDLLVTEQGKVWFTDFNRNSIARLNPTNGQVDEFSIVSSPYSRPSEIEIDPSGKVWFCENATGKVGFLDTGGLSKPGAYWFKGETP